MNIEVPKQCFALVDCNNFYASCERVFNLKARTVPVAVLSNNDGCIIARSAEVKALGIKMGEPVFKVRSILEKNNVMLFSSNFSLYQNMSERVMKILNEFSPETEEYSIDEAFLKFTNMQIKDLDKYGVEIKEAVEMGTDIPVSVGIASTKTLSKVANELAKKHKEFNGVLNMQNASESEIDHYLEMLDLSDVWGIGRAYSYYYKSSGITNAKQFKDLDIKLVKSKMGVVGERMILELRGTSCIALEEEFKPKKGILSSKSFSSPQTSLESLREALSNYMARAGEKLRKQNSVTKVVSVFIRTNYFNKNLPQYSNWYSCKLTYPTPSTSELIKIAIDGLDKIYKEGYLYHKAGVYLTDIIEDSPIQPDLFGEFDIEKHNKSLKLMKAMDSVNRKCGRDSIMVAVQGIKRKWKMKQQKRSPRYSTSWGELLAI